MDVLHIADGIWWIHRCCIPKMMRAAVRDTDVIDILAGRPACLLSLHSCAFNQPWLYLSPTFLCVLSIIACHRFFPISLFGSAVLLACALLGSTQLFHCPSSCCALLRMTWLAGALGAILLKDP